MMKGRRNEEDRAAMPRGKRKKESPSEFTWSSLVPTGLPFFFCCCCCCYCCLLLFFLFFCGVDRAIITGQSCYNLLVTLQALGQGQGLGFSMLID